MIEAKHIKAYLSVRNRASLDDCLGLYPEILWLPKDEVGQFTRHHITNDVRNPMTNGAMMKVP